MIYPLILIYNSLPENITQLFQRYEEFVEKTDNGEHGVTAQYWMGYVNRPVVRGRKRGKCPL